ncbi:MAG: hypothetical protein DLM69_09395, partial [Candidatus Chloroheliales bacterium]
NAYSVYSIRTSNLGAQADTIETLYGPGPTYITSDDDSGGGRASLIIYTTTTATTLYVQVVNKSSLGGFGPDWAYVLTVSQIGQVTPTGTPTETPTTTATATGSPQPTATPACLDAYEPDNDFASARRIGIGESQNHLLCTFTDPTFSGDVDYVYFSANAGVAYSIVTKNLANDTDTKIQLFNTNHGLIDENDNCPGTGDLSSCLNNEVFNSAGIYYVKVFDPRPQGGGLGHSYTLQVTGGAAGTSTPAPSLTPTISPTAAPTNPACLDAYENDGVPASAKLILINTKQSHTFCPAGDADWETFFAKAGKTYTIFTSDLGPGVDTYMFLFDSSLLAPIASNDDYGGSLASRIDFSPVADGQFYVEVKDQGDVGGPEITYSLNLLVAPGGTPATFPPTSVTGGTPLPTFTPQPLGSVTPSLVPTFTPPPTSTTGAPATPGTPGLPTAQPTGTPPGPIAATPTATVAAAPTSPPFPPTGHSLALAQVAVRIFVDRHGNGVADNGEGIGNLVVDFLADDGTLDANTTTDANGSSGGVVIPYAYHRVSIPYLGIVRDLFSGIAPHAPTGSGVKGAQWDIALPPPALPQRIP